MSEEKPIIERRIYENAISRMEKFGFKSIMAPHLFQRRETIKSSLLN